MLDCIAFKDALALSSAAGRGALEVLAAFVASRAKSARRDNADRGSGDPYKLQVLDPLIDDS
jgi:hypothetical protein